MRFMIVCTCGNRFWRSHPCTLRLRTWQCPRYRRPDVHGHQTRCASMNEQLHYAMWRNHEAEIARDRMEARIGKLAREDSRS